MFIPFAFSFNPTLHFKEIQVMLLMFFALFGDIFLLEKIQGSSYAIELLHSNLCLNQTSRLGKGGNSFENIISFELKQFFDFKTVNQFLRGNL